MNTRHPLMLTDGYKLDHRRQYPPGTTRVYSNLTPRASRVDGQREVVFFGLQYFLKEYLERQLQAFFDRPRGLMVDDYARRVTGYLGPNAIGVEHLAALRDLGYLPIEIRALKEGTRVPLRVPMLTIENTHDDFAWLVNYLETLLSASIWLACTTATTAARYRKLLDEAADATGGDRSFVQWQAHDFSFRGMSCLEAAQVSGAAHLLSFTGTDTLPALDFVEEYYGGDNGLVGGSVPATEHSVMCAGGEATERETFERLLALYPTGIVSVVSDTWDLWKVLTETLPAIKGQVLAREGKLVIRPDSGDPVKIVCGDPEAPAGSPARLGVVELLWRTFGGTTNAAGFRVLDPHVGCIYGDAITYERAKAIVELLAKAGFASTNVVFGVGSYTYQHVTRDTYGFAVKATGCVVNGQARDLYKSPVTDSGEKRSARGRLAVVRADHGLGPLTLIENAPREVEDASLLRPVWRDGKTLRHQSLADVRRELWG